MLQALHFVALKYFTVDAEVLLCDFHWEKAWQEWTSKTDNGVANEKQQVLRLLCNISHAVTSEQCRESTTALTDSKIWKQNEKLRNWFGSKWLPSIKVYTFAQCPNVCIYLSGTLNTVTFKYKNFGTTEVGTRFQTGAKVRQLIGVGWGGGG